MASRALADQRVELPEVWELVQRSRDWGGVSASEREGLSALISAHGEWFAPEAKAALQEVLGSADPLAAPAVSAPPELEALWAEHRRPWPPSLPPRTSLSEAAAYAEGRRLFPFTNQRGAAEALAVSAFLDAHPSIAGHQFEAFHNQWATWGTFESAPLQGFFYHSLKPIDDAGQPRGPLWKAYVEAIESGAPAAIVEEAYLRAHISDFQHIVSDETFAKLFALSAPSYRTVVEAYFATLKLQESKLDAGLDPVTVARELMADSMKALLERGTLGMIWTRRVFTKTFDVTDPNARKLWHAYWSIAKTSILGLDVKRPAPKQLVLELSTAEAAALSTELGVALKPGRSTLTPAELTGATFAEPERREHPTTPLKRWPLTFEDLAGDKKMRPGQRFAGTDGVLQADDVRGAIRQAQARVRSELLEQFHQKYPLPIGGLLQYSANMLAMNGTYAEHEAYGDIPNFILPVDNDGQPKNALWRDYVQAYEQHRATGAPSMEKLESLWVKAHMKDFEAVDSPAFRKRLDDFWAKAIVDPTLAPLALYANAMVLGREEFDRATKHGVPYELAFLNVGARAVRSMLEQRSFPFFEQDLRELGHFLSDRELNAQPEVDARGLATDKGLISRSMRGLRSMLGLASLASRGAVQQLTGDTQRTPVPTMIDLRSMLTPEQLTKVDPQVIDFYADPTAFEMKAGVDMPWLSRIVFGVASLALGEGRAPDRVQGSEQYPVEMDLYKDPSGGTHWNRSVVVDGRRRHLFHAKFEQDGRQLRETFRIRGQEVALSMNVEPFESGVKISVDRTRGEAHALPQIQFVTTPDPATGGLRSVGTFGDDDDLIRGSLTVTMKRKAPQRIGPA